MNHVSPLKSDRAYDQLVAWIKSGKFAPGDRLPSEQVLAQEFKINRQTLRQGLKKLVNEGLVVKRPSVGNFVANLPQVHELAVVFPDWMRQANHPHSLIGIILAGISKKLDARKYSVSVFYYRLGQLWDDVGVVLASRHIQGAIIKVDRLINPDSLRQFSDANINAVLIGNCAPDLADLGLPCFRHDPHRAAGQLLRRLLELGHRKIVVFEYTQGLPHLRTALHQVVQRVAQEFGIENGADLLVPIPNALGEHGVDNVKDILSRPNRPTAIIVPDEVVANEVFSYCYQHDIKIPDDLSLASWCNNQPLSHTVPLTSPDTVGLYTREAQMATEHFLNLVAGEKPSSCEVALRSEICWTNSIASPRATAEVRKVKKTSSKSR